MSTILLAVQLRAGVDGRANVLLAANLNTERRWQRSAPPRGAPADAAAPLSGTLSGVVLMDEDRRFVAMSGDRGAAVPEALARLGEAFVWPHGREARPGLPTPRIAEFMHSEDARRVFNADYGADASGWGAVFRDSFDVVYVAPGHGVPAARLGDGSHTLAGGALNTPFPRVTAFEAVASILAGLVFSGALTPSTGVPRLLELLQPPLRSHNPSAFCFATALPVAMVSSCSNDAASSGPGCAEDADAELFVPPYLVSDAPPTTTVVITPDGLARGPLWEGCVRSFVAVASVSLGFVSAQRTWDASRRAWHASFVQIPSAEAAAHTKGDRAPPLAAASMVRRSGEAARGAAIAAGGGGEFPIGPGNRESDAHDASFGDAGNRMVPAIARKRQRRSADPREPAVRAMSAWCANTLNCHERARVRRATCPRPTISRKSTGPSL